MIFVFPIKTKAKTWNTLTALLKLIFIKHMHAQLETIPLQTIGDGAGPTVPNPIEDNLTLRGKGRTDDL